MRPRGLADTGAILALLDANDRWHKACVSAFADLALPLTTSVAVLTELFHLVGDDSREVELVWEFVRSPALQVAELAESELPSVRWLMEKYHDRPMGFADASLVHLAERESLSVVFTVDWNDFETYRIDGTRRFQIAPARRLS